MAKRLKLLNKLRHHLNGGLPDGIHIELEILVRDTVPHVADVNPSDLGMLRNKLRIPLQNLYGTFADGHDVGNHGILRSLIRQKCFSLHLPRIGDDLFCS